MKNKNIYFVGYFQDITNKKKFTDLFQGNNLYFLENSLGNTYNKMSTSYYPSLLYKSELKSSFKIKPDINIEFKSLYRRDLRIFLGSKIINTKSIKQNKLLFIRYAMHKYTTQFKGLSKFNVFNLITYLKNLKLQINRKNQNLVLKLRKYIFRESFLQGHTYAQETINNISFTNNDIFILWGKTQSSYQLLLTKLNEKNVPYYFVEYGELPGTITLSKNGIFGELFSKESWSDFTKKEITQNDIVYAKTILKQIKHKQISTKSYSNNLYFLTKYFWKHSVHTKEKQKIIYVNGSELFISGFHYGRWGVDREGKHPNKMLLEKVVEYFDDSYMIMYKEHPMTVNDYEASLLDPSDFPTVNFINDLNIHDILELADIVISFPSKVVITSLLYGKKTFVLGDFTIPKSNAQMGYFTGKHLNKIEHLVSSTKSINDEEFVNFIARMIKHQLIIYDQKLFYQYNKEDEKLKIKNILRVEYND